jgi:hypothetical protein
MTPFKLPAGRMLRVALAPLLTLAACAADEAGGRCVYEETSALLVVAVAPDEGSGEGSGGPGGTSLVGCETVDFVLLDAGTRTPIDTFATPPDGRYRRSTLMSRGLEPGTERPVILGTITEGTCTPEYLLINGILPNQSLGLLSPDCPGI